MKQLNEITIAELEKYSFLQITEQDLPYVVDTEKKKEYSDKYVHFKRNRYGFEEHDNIIEFLKQNEKDIDKRKVLLISLRRYSDAKEIIDDIQHPLRNQYIKKREGIEEGFKKTKEMVKNLLKDEDITICRLAQGKEQSLVQVISSKDYLEDVPSPGTRKRERETKKVLHKLPSKAVAMALLISNGHLADKSIFTIPNLGNTIWNCTLLNAKQEGFLNQKEINELMNNSKYSTNYKIEKFVPTIKKSFNGIEKYVDIDKMCLTAFMQIAEALEGGEAIFTDGTWDIEDKNKGKQVYYGVEQYLSDYYSVIKEREIEITLGDRTYTTDHAKMVTEKYIDGRYMSNAMIVKQIYLVLCGKREIGDLTKNQIQYIRQALIKGNGDIEVDDLNQMVNVGLMDEQTILKMYETRKFNLDKIHEVKDNLSLENTITPEFIVQNLDRLFSLEKAEETEENQYEKETIKRYLDLYKELYINEKSEEDIIQAGEELINELEKNQKIESVKQEDILHYGLLSEKIYAKLADRGIISMDNLMQAYQKGQIDIHTMAELKKEGNSFTDLDIEQYIIDSYMKIREQKSPDETELKKYIALYKTLRLNGLSEEERNEVANEFIMRTEERVEDDIENGKQRKAFGEEDRRNLYQLEAIPIDTVVLWGEQDEVIHLLKSGDIVAKDVKRLYQNRSLILHDFQNLMKAKDMELEQKINLVNIVFSNPEDVKIREDLFENITELETTVNGNSSNKKQKTNEISVEEAENDETKAAEVPRNRYLFDTAVRYNAWIASDEDVKMTTFKDGHLAVQLPNVKDGIVVIEQFYCLKKTQNGKKKMTDKYGANGYVLTKDEYETYKDRFITNNRLSRSELIDLIRELPNLEDRGIGRELRHTKHQYTKNVQKLLGIPEDLAKARTETQRQKALKRLEDSEEYTAEEKDKIRNTHMMWEEVRKSRELYEER